MEDNQNVQLTPEQIAAQEAALKASYAPPETVATAEDMARMNDARVSALESRMDAFEKRFAGFRD